MTHMTRNIHTDRNANVLVVLSGGQDSTTCMYAAMETRARRFQDGFNAQMPFVKTIGFDYGQKHSVELDCALKIANDAGIDYRLIDLKPLGKLVTSALLDRNLDVSGEHPRLQGRPASFVPNRNAMFLTLAHAYAQEIGATEVWTGVCETDFSGYPDCRQEFIIDLFAALNAGSEQNIMAVTPLMHLNKAETFKLAAECGGLGAVLHDSHTCYNGNHETMHSWGFGCGDCPACLLRAKGWRAYLDSGSIPGRP